MIVNGKIFPLDKSRIDVILPGNSVDKKYRYMVTFQSEKPVTISGISVQHLPKRSLLPQKIIFSDKKLPCHVSGLPIAEGWGRWSDGGSVKLKFDLPTDKPLKFNFQITRAIVYEVKRGDITAKKPSTTAVVYANGKKIAQWEYCYGEPFQRQKEFVVPPEILKLKRPLELEVKIDGCNSPSNLELNEDKRQLGIGFQSLMITTN